MDTADSTLLGVSLSDSSHETTIHSVDLHSNNLPPLPNGPDHTLQSWLDDNLDHLPNDDIMREAASQLRFNNVPVAFPSETVYGLGADATRSSAVKGIYKVKQRPQDNPLIVHVCSLEMLRCLLADCERERRISNATHESPSQGLRPALGVIPVIYAPLIKAFWPGPLTVILPVNSPSSLAPEVTAGLPTFAARMPNNPIALTLIRLTGVPIAAPSANISGRPSPTSAQHVMNDLKGRISLILDGGPCELGLESTVVDGLSSPPTILRPGGITIEQLRTFNGWEKVVNGYNTSLDAVDAVPKAPGMKYTHYSPQTPLLLYESGAIRPSHENIHDLNGGSGGVAVLTSLSWTKQDFEGCGDVVVTESLGSDATRIAQALFGGLRDLDSRAEVSVIVVEGIPECDGVGSAVMNRLRKAATKVVAAK